MHEVTADGDLFVLIEDHFGETCYLNGFHITDGITKVHKLYLQRDFKITNMHTDCEFEPLRNEMTALGINLKYASKKKHVPEIERFILTVKERVRSV